jgi:hypothetical protein
MSVLNYTDGVLPNLVAWGLLRIIGIGILVAGVYGLIVMAAMARIDR